MYMLWLQRSHHYAIIRKQVYDSGTTPKESANSSVNFSASEDFVEDCILLEYDTVSVGNQILMFQENG
jgi:hypothetical protein